MKGFLNYLLNKQWILHIVMWFLSEDKKEQIYIARLKSEFAFWGHDISNMTDREIKKGLSKMSKLFSKCGFTINEMEDKLNKKR